MLFLSSSITKLTQELDEHAQSDQALRRLEEKVETIKIDLKKHAKENKALKDELANSEETAAHCQIR
jgi:predicted RNase H-like nuclease (RuvC/YqgF family)